LGIFNVWWDEHKSTDLPQSRKTPEIPVAPMLRNKQSLNDFRVVASKNLFSQDRTGPDFGLATPKQGQGSLDGKILLGTMIIGNQRVALIGGSSTKRKLKDHQVETLHLGEQWEGFKVVEITSDTVIFQNRNGQTTLNFPE
jgi:hypothetical protein